MFIPLKILSAVSKHACKASKKKNTLSSLKNILIQRTLDGNPSIVTTNRRSLVQVEFNELSKDNCPTDLGSLDQVPGFKAIVSSDDLKVVGDVHKKGLTHASQYAFLQEVPSNGKDKLLFVNLSSNAKFEVPIAGEWFPDYKNIIPIPDSGYITHTFYVREISNMLNGILDIVGNDGIVEMTFPPQVKERTDRVRPTMLKASSKDGDIRVLGLIMPMTPF
jgi:hypothetical protein